LTGGWDKFASSEMGALEIKTPGIIEIKVRAADAATWRAINLSGLKLALQ